MRAKLIIALLLLAFAASAQDLPVGTVYGKVTDEHGHPIEMANVVVPELLVGYTTNSRGYYELTLLSDTTWMLHFSFVGYEQRHTAVRLRKGEKRKLDMVLKSTAMVLPDAVISDRATDASSLTRLNAKQATLLPSMGGGVETLIKTLPGVVSNNELSSQYRVRGGNFDENLIYVNGIEIYRPFLVGSGQQEGLSFVNPEMVENVKFSAGGYDAQYGDKMSSVLDITYKRPQAFEASLSASLLGAQVYVGHGDSTYSQMHGLRYKTSKYMLGGLATSGNYQPTFIDYQTYITWKVGGKTKAQRAKSPWSMAFLAKLRLMKF